LNLFLSSSYQKTPLQIAAPKIYILLSQAPRISLGRMTAINKFALYTYYFYHFLPFAGFIVLLDV